MLTFCFFIVGGFYLYMLFEDFLKTRVSERRVAAGEVVPAPRLFGREVGSRRLNEEWDASELKRRIARYCSFFLPALLLAFIVD